MEREQIYSGEKNGLSNIIKRKVIRTMKKGRAKSTNNGLIIITTVFLSFVMIILFAIMSYFLITDRRKAAFSAQEIVSDKIRVVLERNEESIKDYKSSLKEEFTIRASTISYILENNENLEKDVDKLKEIAEKLMVDEIHLFTPSGVIYGGTNPEYYGFSLYSGTQMGFFLPILSDESLSLCQDITPNTAEGKLMMYAMVWREDKKGLVEIGVDARRLAYEMNGNEVLSLIESMPVTEGRMLFVAEKENGIIIGATDSKFLGASLSSLGISDFGDKTFTQGKKVFNDNPSYVSIYNSPSFIFLVTQNVEDAYQGAVGELLILFLYILLITSILDGVIVISNRKLSKERDERLKENEKRNKKLSSALYEAQAASKSKSAFMMSMSHDLRTPMNAILGYTDLLEKEVKNEKEKRYVNNIKISGKQLMTLLGNVLSMTRIESGRLELDKKEEEIISIMEDVYVIIKERADEKGVSFTLNNYGENHTLLVDRGKYTEILMNILTNAVKYTPKGGSVTMNNTIIDKGEEGVLVESVVEDTGIGMSPSFLPHIFDTFERESLSGRGKEEGYGLGMSITKALVDLMGGDISIDSIQGMGTVVKVSVSFKKTTKKAKSACVDSVSWSNKRALLVEDNDLNAEIAHIMLENLGFETERVDNGYDAVDRVENSEKPFDIVYMDILMPGIDGYETAIRIRNLKGIRSSVPIVAMTANAFLEDKIKSIESGMDGHIAKPLEVVALVNETKRVFGEKNE